MRVNSKDSTVQSIQNQLADLEHLLQQLLENRERPCPGCVTPCPCSGSTTCDCVCSPECDDCPGKMSSDAKSYPIEEKIVPLVYAFFDTHLCDPCWSCEGHRDGDGGDVLKLPRVWFYSPSVVYPRLIAEFLDDLTFKKRIQHNWSVRILSWSDTSEVRFSLEPVVSNLSEANLEMLQRDAGVIADSLKEGMQEKGSTYLKSLLNLSRT